MTRLPDWPERLAAYLAAQSRLPFAWGTNDCVTFAAGAVHAVTGAAVDLPSWSDEAQAQAELAARGGLEAAVDGVLLPVPVGMAMRGDVVMLEHSGVRWLAVCSGTHAWTVALRESFPAVAPMRHAVKAWGVG